jgi:hypothetical protein
MTSAEATWTVQQAKSLTQQEVLQRLLIDTGLGEVGTATGGGTTTIVDTGRLKSTQRTTNDIVGGWARIALNANSVGAAPEGQVRAITTYAPSTGTVTVDAFSSGVAVSDLYELWYLLNPLDVIQMLDDLMTNQIIYPCYTVCTEVPDGDMEQDNITDWTASGATVTKRTTAPHMYGKRHLRVVDSGAAGDYAVSNSIRVEAGKGFHLSALCRVEDSATTATLQLWDDTNAAAIDSKTVDINYMGRVYFSGTIPSGCFSVSIRLITVTASKYTEWDEVVFQPHTSRVLRMPWWAKSRDDIKGIFRLDTQSVKQDVWSPELKGLMDHSWQIQEGSYGGGQLIAVSPHKVNMSRPYFVLGNRNEEAFSDDTTDTRFLDERLVVGGLAVQILEHLKKPQFKNSDLRWINQKLGEWILKYNEALRGQNRRLQDILQGQTVDIPYSTSKFRWGNL